MYETTMPGLVVIGIVVVEIFLIYPMTSQDHVLKELYVLMG